MMNKSTIALIASVFMMSCGGAETKQQEQPTDKMEVTTNEEAEVAGEISTEVQSDIEDIQQSTEDNLQEVDSLLENF